MPAHRRAEFPKIVSNSKKLLKFQRERDGDGGCEHGDMVIANNGNACEASSPNDEILHFF